MVGLKKSLSLFDLVLYGVGIIVGAGIYALIGPAVALGGNATWVSFLIGAFIASLTGLSFAELGSLYPQAAAEFVYVKKSIGNELLAFMVGWVTIFVGVFAVAAVSISFGKYLETLLPVLGFHEWAVLIIVFVTGVAIAGIGESAWLNACLTLVTVGGLLFLFAIGVPSLGSVNYLEAPNGFGGIIGAAALIFFAYLGFDDIANAAEESKNAKKIVPKAIIISVLISAVLYVGIAVSAVSLVDWRELGASQAPLALAAGKAVPEAGFILSVIALFATASTILISTIASSRMIYGMAKNHSLPKLLSRVSSRFKTPWVATLVVSAVAMFWANSSDLEYVANVTNVGAFITFAMINICLIFSRYKFPELKREFRVPLNIGRLPVPATIGLLSCLYMLSTFGIDMWLMQGAIVGVGVGIHLYAKRR